MFFYKIKSRKKKNKFLKQKSIKKSDNFFVFAPKKKL